MRDPSPKIENESFVPFIYPVKNKIQLQRNFKKKNVDFLDIIFRRESLRKFTKFTKLDLESLLYHCCQIKSMSIDNQGFLLTKRITPSAGGRHPVDLLISLPEKDRTLSYYNPLDHSLAELEIEKSKLNKFFSTINDNLLISNACIIWFSIQVNKTTSKYNNAESLYWKDVGVLIYAIQLVTTYLGFNSCPLGTLASKDFYQLFNDKNLLSGGGILIGNI